MLNSDLFDSLEQNSIDNISDLFSSIGEYDDPYFVLINHAESSEKIIDIYSCWIKENKDDVYSCKFHEVKDGLIFISISCEKEKILPLANEIVVKLESTIHVSIFHHNCLGKPMETFRWATQLLEETIQRSGSKSEISINDFSDRENWTGVDRYRR